jgi:uncharacterized protein (TIGR02145 family)
MRFLFTILIAALSLNAFSQVPVYFPSEGLVAWYPFNGNAHNESENGNDGTVNGATLTSDRFGNANSAYSFDGLNDNISVNRNYQSSFAVSLWFNPISTPGFNPLIEAFDSNWELQLKDNTIDYIGFSVSNYQEYISSVTAQVNDWQHLVCAFTNDSVFIYFNGLLTDEFSVLPLLNSNGTYNFGSSISGSAQYLNGKLDDIGIWNRALSEEEVLSLYNAPPPNPGCTDVTACNFNPEATLDDETCYSCDLPASHCGEGTVWDSETQECIVANPTDTNFDGCTDLNDLLDILAAYGACAVAEFTCGDLLEYQGYDYETVQIGGQCWFSENCRYLPVVSPSSAQSTTAPYYYVYDYQGTDVASAQATANYATYGVLYNWPAVMTDGICPSGWHIPSDGEWQTMEISLGMSEADATSDGWRGSPVGDSMKSTSGWFNNGNVFVNGSNSSGFTGLPGGYSDSGVFNFNGVYGVWWSASESGSNSWQRALGSSYDNVGRNVSGRYSGFSARCVKDQS